jgi:acid phosphatase type 7
LALVLVVAVTGCSTVPPARLLPPNQVVLGTPIPTPSPTAALLTGTLVGAGDIAMCDSTGDSATAALIAQIPGAVFAAGDDAYPDGTPAQFHECYAPTWGLFRDRTMPAPGNHDFVTPGGAGYFGYFGRAAGTAGEGWYSKDFGGWHIVVLNSNCGIVGCGPGSAQLTWLQEDLAAHPAACTLAIWHHPRFSSGHHGDDLSVTPFWDVLEQAGADLVINGHDHDYERFGPQDPNGTAEPGRGIREFVVGTGGATLRPFGPTKPNSEVRDAGTYGVLVLSLHPDSYEWRFVPIAGETFTDAGSGTCH